MKPIRHRRFSLTRHRRSLWALPAFGLLLAFAACAVTWLQVQSSERALVATVIRDTERFVASFEHYTQQAIKDADRMIGLVKHEFEQYGVLDLPRLVRSGLVEGNEFFMVSIVDAEGNIVASTQEIGTINVADREYFRLHATQDTGQLDIGKPIVGRHSGRTLIQLSRRMNRPDGSFAGVVLLSATPAYSTAFYKEADLGSSGSLSVLGLDGISRAHRVGEDPTSSPDGSEMEIVARAEAIPVGQYQARSEHDHIERIVAYRRLVNFPLIVTAAQSTAEVFGDFHRARRNYLIAAAAAVVVILAFFGIVTVLAFRLQRHRAVLKAERRFLEVLVDNVPSGITVRSMQPATVGQYVLWNESNTIITGIRMEDALGKTVGDVTSAEYAAQIIKFDQQLLASPMVQDVVQEIDLPDRGRRIYHLVRAPIFGADGDVDYVMTNVIDITEERAQISQLQLASKVFESTADGIMMSDAEDRVIMVNAAFSRLTGYAADEIVGIVLAESPFRPIDLVESNVRMERLHRDGYVTGEVARFRKDGAPLSLWITATCIRETDGTVRNYVRVFTDISLLKETQQRLEQLASFDTLTGLPNRRLLHDRLDQALLRAHRHHASIALMFIDLDGFKAVNDTLGHDVGDLLLREVAQRLSKCIRGSDTIGRFGGDEFAIVIEDASLPTDAVLIGERIVDALATPFNLNGHCVRTAASMGIAIYPRDGVDATMLLKNADIAMYQAKRGGRNRFEFIAKVDEPLATAD